MTSNVSSATYEDTDTTNFRRRRGRRRQRNVSKLGRRRKEEKLRTRDQLIATLNGGEEEEARDNLESE